MPSDFAPPLRQEAQPGSAVEPGRPLAAEPQLGHVMRRLGLISRSAALWAGLALAPGLVGQACEVDPDACQRSRTCAPTPGQGGQGGVGPASTGAIRELGDACAIEGQYACAGHAQRVQLVCKAGTFVKYGVCAPTERCDTESGATGLCQPVVAECLGHGPGDVVCRGSERIACGVDLVT